MAPARGDAGPGGGRSLASLSVRIGRVSAAPGGTHVHVLVINVLQGNVSDVHVRCEARDAQGLQVGDAELRIGGIAKADIAFGDVLFPSDLTNVDSRFSCVAGAASAAS